MQPLLISGGVFLIAPSFVIAFIIREDVDVVDEVLFDSQVNQIKAVCERNVSLGNLAHVAEAQSVKLTGFTRHNISYKRSCLQPEALVDVKAGTFVEVLEP